MFTSSLSEFVLVQPLYKTAILLEYILFQSGGLVRSQASNPAKSHSFAGVVNLEVERVPEFFNKLIIDLLNTDMEFALFVGLIVIATIVLDAVAIFNKNNRAKVGLVAKETPNLRTEVKAVLTKRYISEIQGLSGCPDAVVIENGYFIPVERKPLARKIRDRYVGQLLVYMRLIEEFEGKRPPYGYLILGKNCRRVKIENSEERQKWLQKILDEMKLILQGSSTPIAAPYYKKCQQCSVNSHCTYAELEPIKIRSSTNHTRLLN